MNAVRGRVNAVRDACPFCDYAGPNDVLWSGSGCYVVEPLRQITPGHVLVIPADHAEDFADDADITARAFRAASLFAQAEEIGDCNLITSKGNAASQTVKHVHIHVLPRTFDDSVRLPWNNPHVSPTPTHHLYQRMLREQDALLKTLGEFAKADGGRFDWEANEAAQLVGHARRYMGKPGEVLYCNWRGCIHAAEPEDRFGPPYRTDYVGRALKPEEGVPWFKGRVHSDCMDAIRAENRRFT